jgi:Tol biopolymer transport system component
MIIAVSISLVSAASAAHPGRNGLIAFVANDAIYTMYPDGGHKNKLTVRMDDGTQVGAATYPTWSPNGKQLAFIAVRTPSDGEPIWLFVVNADGSGGKAIAPVANTTDLSTAGGTLSWSPDGSEIAYTAGVGYSRAVNVASVEPFHWRSLFVDGYDPAWSPDGRWIVFGSDYGLEAVDPEGFNRRSLVPGVYAVRTDWSPDGSKLLFDNRRPEVGGPPGTIYTVNADGSQLHALYEDGSVDGWAASWSPDGMKIVFTVQDDNFAESLKFLKPDGRVQGLGYTPIPGAMPDWQPCGQGVRCPDTAPCVVPRVIGFSLARAGTALRKANCAAGTIKRPRHVALRKTVVSKQSPRAKTRLPNGAEVNLVLRRRR